MSYDLDKEIDWAEAWEPEWTRGPFVHCATCGAIIYTEDPAGFTKDDDGRPFCNRSCMEQFWELNPDAVVDQIIGDITKAHRELAASAKGTREAFRRWAFGKGE